MKPTRWDYRCVSVPDGRGGRWLEIREVHYDKKGRIVLWSDKAAAPGGETGNDLFDCLTAMRCPAISACMMNPFPGQEVLMIEDLENSMKKHKKVKS